MAFVAAYITSLSESEYYKQAYRYYNEERFHKIESWANFLGLSIEYEANRLRPIALSRSGKEAFDDAYRYLELQARHHRYEDESIATENTQRYIRDGLKHVRFAAGTKDEGIAGDTSSGEGGSSERESTPEIDIEDELTKIVLLANEQAMNAKPAVEALEGETPEAIAAENKDAEDGGGGEQGAEEQDPEARKSMTANPEDKPDGEIVGEGGKPDNAGSRVAPPGKTEDSPAANPENSVSDTVKVEEQAGVPQDTPLPPQDSSPSLEEVVVVTTLVPSSSEPPLPKEDPTPAPDSSTNESPPPVIAKGNQQDRYFQGFGGRWVINSPGKWRDKKTGKPCTHGPAWVRTPTPSIGQRRIPKQAWFRLPGTQVMPR